MASQKSKVNRKKSRTSKHVIKAQNNKRKQITIGNETTNDNSKETKDNDKKRQQHVKDPSEAASYLTSWKESKSSSSSSSTTSSWKFNKNTQSWLIRHMYEPEKVAKGVFTILLEYLEGLEGKTTIERMRAEACRRALRYKEFEKTISSSSSKRSKEGNDVDKDNDDNDGNQEIQKEDDNNKNDATTTTKPSKSSDLSKEEQEEEALRWTNLSENDKRKEYKRARKILDIVKES